MPMGLLKKCHPSEAKNLAPTAPQQRQSRLQGNTTGMSGRRWGEHEIQGCPSEPRKRVTPQIHDAIRDGMPYDEFVRELLTASGSQSGASKLIMAERGGDSGFRELPPRPFRPIRFLNLPLTSSDVHRAPAV
jgi:hypothetical protein